MKTEEELIWEAYANKKTLVKEDVRGEYWITDSGVEYADGDVGDMNHEMIVAQNIMGELLSFFNIEFDEYTPTDFSFLEKEHYKEIYDVLVDENFIEDDGETDLYDLFMDDWLGYVEKYLKQQAIENIDAKLEVANGKVDAREYGLKYDGWKRIKGNWIETWTLTQSDLKRIVSGMYDILDQEGKDIDENKNLFNIEVRAANRTFTDIPWGDLKTGNINRLLQYRDKTYR